LIKKDEPGDFGAYIFALFIVGLLFLIAFIERFLSL